MPSTSSSSAADAAGGAVTAIVALPVEAQVAAIPKEELENLVSASDDRLDAYLDYSDLELKYSVTAAKKFQCVLVVDGLPTFERSRHDRFVSHLVKLFAKEGFEIAPGHISIPYHLPRPDSSKAADADSDSDSDSDGDDENVEMSCGYLFLYAESSNQASEILAKMQGYPIDKSHSMIINSFVDVESYAHVPSEWDETAMLGPAPEFRPREFLRDWLLEENVCDQFFTLNKETLSVYRNTSSATTTSLDTELVSECERNYVTATWSPRGLYLVSLHPPGVAISGGPKNECLGRLYHPRVSHIAFSPLETYLVTYSPEPLQPSPNAQWGRDSYGHHMIVWDVATNKILKTFSGPYAASPSSIASAQASANSAAAAASKANVSANMAAGSASTGDAASSALIWPFFKFSWDEKYVACVAGSQARLIVYELPSFSVLDKATFSKITNVACFDWMPYSIPPSDDAPAASKGASGSPNSGSDGPTTSSPELLDAKQNAASESSGTKRSRRGGKNKNKSAAASAADTASAAASTSRPSSAGASPAFSPPPYTIAYFVPCNGQVAPAQLVLFNVATRQDLRRYQVFFGINASVSFSANGDYLLFKVDRTNRINKIFFTSLELIHMREKDFPRDTLEVRRPLCRVELSPSSPHLAMITWENVAGTRVAENPRHENPEIAIGAEGKMSLSFYRICGSNEARALPVVGGSSASGTVGGGGLASGKDAINNASVTGSAAASTAATTAAIANAMGGSIAGSAAAAAAAAAAAQSSGLGAIQLMPPPVSSQAGMMRQLMTFDNRSCNTIAWSPRGRFCATAAIASKASGPIEFFDADPGVRASDVSTVTTELSDNRIITTTKPLDPVAFLGKATHTGSDVIAWDPSGRFLATVSLMRGARSTDQFYMIWSLSGTLLTKETKESLRAFGWRPRPASLLSPKRIESIKKNIRTFIKNTRERDRAVAEQAARKQQEERERLYNDFLVLHSAALSFVPGTVVKQEIIQCAAKSVGTLVC